MFSLLFLSLFSCDSDSSSLLPDATAGSLFGFSFSEQSSHHDLKQLHILRRDLLLVSSRYVDSHKFKSDLITEMFLASIDKLEEDIDSILTEYQSIENLEKRDVSSLDVEEISIIKNKKNNQGALYLSISGKQRIFAVQKFSKLENIYTQLLPIASYIDETLSPSQNRAEVEYTLINGLLRPLDPHTLLLPPVQAAEMDMDNQGEFGGLGIEITTKDGVLTVKQPIEGTPASKVGLKAEDKIVRIEETSTINMDIQEAVYLLRGRVGDPVTIMVMRKGWTSPKPFTIVRGRIKIDPVKGEMLGGNIGYIKLQAFNANVSDDMNVFLENFQKQKMKGLILDLRSNPGGYLRQAQLVANRFISKGTLVATVEGAEREYSAYQASSSNTLLKTPMVVLVNGNSASASEIVAGALRNLDRAIIVGERTFGKGSVQHLYSNPDDSQLKLTVAQYLTPGDQSIQSVGIPPDILLQPSVIREDEDGKVISLYYREWLEREGDLEHHLDNKNLLEGQTSFQVRYLSPNTEEEQDEIRSDWEVLFAQNILRNTTGPSRENLLDATKDIVEQAQQIEKQSLLAGFQNFEIDWSEGQNQSDINLHAELDMGEDHILVAGEKEKISLKVKNMGDHPIYQLSATTTSESSSLDHREFYIGKLMPNEERSIEKEILLPYGFDSEYAQLHLVFRDPKNTNLQELYLPFTTNGHQKPEFSYHIDIIDGGTETTKGNQDGIPNEGEIIELNVQIKNTGKGAARGGYFRLKNLSRKFADLQLGTINLGTLQNQDSGASCEEGQENCYYILRPGEIHEGVVRIELRSQPIQEMKESSEDTASEDSIIETMGTWNFEIVVADNYAYDYATIMRGGFGRYYQQKQNFVLTPNEKFSKISYVQPHIEVLSVPDLQGTKSSIQISGLLHDGSDDPFFTSHMLQKDSHEMSLYGIEEVIVFHNENKIYYKHESQNISKVPFVVDAQAHEGENHFYILVRNKMGLTNTKHISYFYQKESSLSSESN